MKMSDKAKAELCFGAAVAIVLIALPVAMSAAKLQGWW